jgi:hypothetical protein
LWQVFFTDGTDPTYLAIVHLQGDPCEEHMDGTTTKQIIQNVSTLTFNHYYGHDNNIDASVNMLDYQGWESLVN